MCVCQRLQIPGLRLAGFDLVTLSYTPIFAPCRYLDCGWLGFPHWLGTKLQGHADDEHHEGRASMRPFRPVNHTSQHCVVKVVNMAPKIVM